MLKIMRDQFRHLKFVLWFVVLVFVLLIFVDWGAGRGKRAAESVAIQVGERVIDEQEFLRRVRSTNERYRQQFGDQWERFSGQINIAEQAASELIQRELLLAEARSAGLVVSDSELRDSVLSLPAFTNEDGSFVGTELYTRILRANRMTPDQFERDMREDILLKKLQRLLTDGVIVGDSEVLRELRRERESASFDLVFLRSSGYLDEVDISEDEVASYFAEHKGAFERDEERVVRYLLVDANALRRLLPVEDEEIEQYYRSHTDEFRRGEQARARHILIRVAPDAPEPERRDAELRAQGIAKIARSGADFAELAQKHSEDPGSRDQGGDIGWFERGRMVEEFENAVFDHKPGEIVGPVSSQFGYHVIKVEGYRPAKVRPLEEVREQVRFALLEGRAAGEAETRARELAERVRSENLESDQAWEALASEDEAVSLNTTPPFSADEVVPGLGRSEDLATAVFDAEPGDVGEPSSTSRGWVVWQLAEVRPAGVPELDEVRAKVESRLLQQKAADRARQAAQQLARAWSAGEDPERLAEEAGASVTAVTEHSRGESLPGVGIAPDLEQAVFQAEAGSVVGPIAVGTQGAAVAEVTGLQTLTDDQIADLREDYRQRLVEQRASELRGALLNERRRETVITVDDDLVARFAPQQASNPSGDR